MGFSFTNRKHAPQEATDFLRGNARLAALLPAVQRMAKLQQDCWEVLPSAFKACEIFAFDGGELTLAVPNTAVAAKLKQQVPNMLVNLNGKGWQINNIRFRVQIAKGIAPVRPSGEGLKLSEAAVDSFDEMSKKLEPTAANEPLIAAMQRLVARRRT
ncbi:DciA family protein [Pseudoduganella sp. OTU4001]|uniref:DciA family protein n=1 Tax=Pseudoduganella sp. OTU4001 TaxID=3043854 RepID=UPI00313BCAF6